MTEQLTQYVLKNNFVLTKIMETHPSMNLNIKKLITTQKNKKLKRKKYCNYCGQAINELGDQCSNCGNSVYVGQ
jgi:tRNA(Ile2) C34 agmatinyltransferase TiaS